MTPTLRLAEELIARPSVSPHDAGCQPLIAERLAACGFECIPMPHGPHGAVVGNLWALRRGGRAGPMVGLAGHTDVVPPGPDAAWTTPPFVPSHRDGFLYGRGAADMKTSVAAMVVAAEEFVAAHPDHAGAIAFLLTSDEEAQAVDGTVRIVEWLQQRGQRLQACIVGEPTSVQRLGDTMKNGRRGSLSARLRVIGVQGHVAYPHLARNPVHAVAPLLAELAATRWDEGDAHFPPTTWQVSNLHAGTGAGNVIPGEAIIDFNFRFAPASTAQGLQARVREALGRHGIGHEIEWALGAEPFLTEPGTLSMALAQAVQAECGLVPELSTSGGTSDGRFIRRICDQVIEFGPVNASIHQVDERVEVAAVEPLKSVYRRTLELLLA
ncbi:MAG: succinyl-diaminopimelate desuccinylase [Rubrivivax sp. SCN 71-131]|nr:MAG: succinyl-diaminopimelate desuccinylase [Rubrivivax sp. SCN 71-131]